MAYQLLARRTGGADRLSIVYSKLPLESAPTSQPVTVFQEVGAQAEEILNDEFATSGTSVRVIGALRHIREVFESEGRRIIERLPADSLARVSDALNPILAGIGLLDQHLQGADDTEIRCRQGDILALIAQALGEGMQTRIIELRVAGLQSGSSARMPAHDPCQNATPCYSRKD